MEKLLAKVQAVIEKNAKWAIAYAVVGVIYRVNQTNSNESAGGVFEDVLLWPIRMLNSATGGGGTTT